MTNPTDDGSSTPDPGDGLATLEAGARAHLLEITGGDEAFVDELIDTFLDDATGQLDGLRAAVAGGPADHDALVRPAHSLKSSAASVGATRLADLSRELEAAARLGAVGDAATRVAAIELEFGAARAALLATRVARDS